jgi:hypothetical protein
MPLPPSHSYAAALTVALVVCSQPHSQAAVSHAPQSAQVAGGDSSGTQAESCHINTSTCLFLGLQSTPYARQATAGMEAAAPNQLN